MKELQQDIPTANEVENKSVDSQNEQIVIPVAEEYIPPNQNTVAAKRKSLKDKVVRYFIILCFVFVLVSIIFVVIQIIIGDSSDGEQESSTPTNGLYKRYRVLTQWEISRSCLNIIKTFFCAEQVALFFHVEIKRFTLQVFKKQSTRKNGNDNLMQKFESATVV
eukprot:snap_masked-scaffold_16-processed-gene-6.68-mRNA-1 protein AED:1.00 eAED:1.00 QI:0/0/0/0/1/1/5/0/163